MNLPLTTSRLTQLPQSPAAEKKIPHLCKLVYLLHDSCKEGMDTLINQTLHVMDSFFIRQVQTKLVLHLE